MLILVAGLVLSAATPTARRIAAQEPAADLSGLTATITGSNDGVNLRSEPTFGAEVVGTLPDGTVVELRIDEADTVLDADGETRWWPVRVDGTDGWVAGYYLQQGRTATEPSAAPPAEEPPEAQEDEGADAGEVPGAPGGAVTGATAAVSITAEDGANFRAEPGANSEVLAILPFATVVELRIDEADTVVSGGVRWWPVRFDGEAGWVAGDYLADTDGNVVPDREAPELAVASQFAPGEYVAALTDDGTGLNIRVEAGTESERVGLVPEGDVVQVMDGPFAISGSVSGWYLITDGETTGYVDGDFLVRAAQPPPPAEEADPVVEQPDFDPAFFAAGDYAAAGNDGVNVRSGASLDAGLLTTLMPGDVVEVLSGPQHDGGGEGWYLVTDGATTGYANGNFLTPSAAPAPPPPPPPAPAAGVATGNFIIPVTSYIFTQAYGCSAFVFEPYDANLGCNFHNGIDLANVAYTPLLAADGGVVKYAGWCDCGLGYYVEIDHGNGFSTLYGHMADVPWVAAGQAVAQGQQIGPMGSTGLSTGSHVHFMIKLNGSTVDPLLYLPPV